MSELPAFLITMDAEGDNLWAAPATVTTDNARYVPRFQALCERYGFKPTWLTNYEMAQSPEFCEIVRDVLDRGTGEIGMHLHAWDSPPLYDDGPTGQAYLIEYPDHIMREKIRFMTDLLEERFERTMLSHRAGRWAMDGRYARLLVEHGYRVDCSVTPRVSWADTPGDPAGDGGTDYSRFPDRPYFMDLDSIDRQGGSPLLEVPVSIVDRPRGRVAWLRPEGGNLSSMLAILEEGIAQGRTCVELPLHSSELMPGGSPTFQTPEDIESLYADLEVLFAFARGRFRGLTLSEFHAEFAAR